MKERFILGLFWISAITVVYLYVFSCFFRQKCGL